MNIFYSVDSWHLKETIYGMCGEESHKIKCIRFSFGRKENSTDEQAVWISEKWYVNFVLKNIYYPDWYYLNLVGMKGKEKREEEEEEEEGCEPPAKVQALIAQPDVPSIISNQNENY